MIKAVITQEHLFTKKEPPSTTQSHHRNVPDDICSDHESRLRLVIYQCIGHAALQVGNTIKCELEGWTLQRIIWPRTGRNLLLLLLDIWSYTSTRLASACRVDRASGRPARAATCSRLQNLKHSRSGAHDYCASAHFSLTRWSLAKGRQPTRPIGRGR